MNQSIENKIIQLPTTLQDLSMKLPAVQQGGELNASAEHEGKRVVIGGETGTEHVLTKRESIKGLFPISVRADHSIPGEGGRTAEGAKYGTGMGEVAVFGDGIEGKELGGGIRVGDGAGDDEAGVEMVDLGDGEKEMLASIQEH